MKSKLYLIGLLSILFAFYACSEDSNPVVDLNEDEDETPDEPTPEPELDDALLGTWYLDPTGGSLAVGPSADDLSWWAISGDEVQERPCFYDDGYVFNSDGTFENQMGDQTWLEAWQSGVEDDGCGTPIAPHDGSTVGEWSTSDGSVTVSGNGIFLGLAKVHNSGENGDPSNDTITYDYTLSEGGSVLEVTIEGWNSDVPEATWYYRFTKDDSGAPDANTELAGEWSFDPTGGSLAVGPSADDLSWWSITDADIEDRSCLYDDLYIFNEDGTFENEMGSETWLEEWQTGVEEDGCGSPVSPHDGSTVGDWEISNDTVTISGSGLFLGLAKVHNTSEDGNPANDTISYNYELSDDEQTLEVTIDGWNADMPEATWYYRFIKQ